MHTCNVSAGAHRASRRTETMETEPIGGSARSRPLSNAKHDPTRPATSHHVTSVKTHDLKCIQTKAFSVDSHRRACCSSITPFSRLAPAVSRYMFDRHQTSHLRTLVTRLSSNRTSSSRRIDKKQTSSMHLSTHRLSNVPIRPSLKLLLWSIAS